VYYPVLVGIVERKCGLARNAERVLKRELPFANKPGPQALAFDEGHGEPQLASCFAGVEDGEDMRMLEPGREMDLASKPVRPESRGQFWVQNLERHGTVMLQVVRQKDCRHATAPELPLEDVAVAERFSDIRRNTAQEWLDYGREMYKCACVLRVSPGAMKSSGKVPDSGYRRLDSQLSHPAHPARVNHALCQPAAGICKLP